MDPKTLASLDPKLRETYERVMGNSGGVLNPSQTNGNTNLTPPFPITDKAAFATSSPDQIGAQPEPITEQPTGANPFEAVNTNTPTPGNTSGTLNPDGLSTAFPAPIDLAPIPQAPTDQANISTSATVPGLDMTSPFAIPTPIDAGTIPAQEPFPIAGSNIVDTTSFTLNPMGQKTDAGTIGSSPIDPLTSSTTTTIESGSDITPSIDQTVPAYNTTPTKASSPLLRILYISAAIIFFVMYTFIWLKLFKFPLPF